MIPIYKRILLAIGVLFASLMAFAAPASAQATRTWVSGVGDDANPCSRTAPCKTFAGAISKTAAGGEINCIDQGAYGAVTITKSIALVCEGVTAGVLHSSTNGIVINAAATDVIFLKGLDINGSPPTSPGLNGVRFLAGGALTVEDCLIRGSLGATPNGFGILFAPSGSARLVVNDTIINNNGSGSTGGGILVQPTGTGNANVAISNSRISANFGSGIRVDSTGNTGTGGLFIEISGSEITSGTNGLTLASPAATNPIIALVTGSRIANNSAVGVVANGAGVIARFGGNTITGNVNGIAPLGGSTVRSFGDNYLAGNGTDGAFTGAVLPKS